VSIIDGGSKYVFKDWQIGSQILSFQYPASQAMTTERMAKIMYTGSFSPSTMGNPGLPKEFPEVFVDIPMVIACPFGEGKKNNIGIREQMNLLHIGMAPVEEFPG